MPSTEDMVCKYRVKYYVYLASTLLTIEGHALNGL